MVKQTFSAQVADWARKAKKRNLVVFQQSAQDVISLMQTPVAAGGNMPVDTGFLRASLTTTINAPAQGYRSRPTDKYSYDWAEAEFVLTINKTKIGDSIYAVYLANYAWFQEYGSNGREGRGFVRLAALQWQKIVDDNVRKAQAIK